MTPPRFNRRTGLKALALLCAPAWVQAARPGRAARLAATWVRDARHELGVLQVDAGGGLAVARHIALPTRAHGLCAEADGSLLVVARRPGDWLLRWHPVSGATRWHWVEGDRRLNGHGLHGVPGGPVLTTETDQASGAGLIGVRDPATLARRAEWPTLGTDPHALLVLPRAVGGLPAGTLLVANGGIPTQSETGRAPRGLDRMDPSLVALDARTGAPLGQWRLDDPRLSVRHLAFDPVSGRVGVALQARHDDAAERDAAPVLATWDGTRLAAVPASGGVQGYGGDICARTGGGFLVSATQADRVLPVDARGRVLAPLPLREACALASDGASWWGAGGQAAWLGGDAPAALDGLTIDNHWLPLA